MKKAFKLICLTITLFLSLQGSLNASSCPYHKKHKSSRTILKQINKTTKEIQETVNNINQTVNEIEQTVNTINQTTTQDLAVDLETLAIVTELEICSCNCTPIVPSDFADANGRLSQTYIINQPGKYCLKGDVVFAPTAPGVPAINIAASNVLLDLNGYTLSQISKTRLNVIGIRVNPGLDNLKITNGTVRDFSGSGIDAGTQRTAGLATPPSITNFTVDSVNLLNNMTQSSTVQIYAYYGAGGIVIRNAQDIILTNVNANQNILAGFYGVDIVDFYVTNSHFDNNTWGTLTYGVPNITQPPGVVQPFASGMTLVADVCNLAPPAGGGSVGYCDTTPANALTSGNVILSNNTFNGNSSVGNSYGLFFLSSGSSSPFNNIVVDSCTMNGTTSIVSDPTVVTELNALLNISGLCLDSSVAAGAITINNCQVSQTSATINVPFFVPPSLTDVEVFGISVEDLTQGVVAISNCQIGETTCTINAELTNTSDSPGTVTLAGLDLEFNSPGSTSVTNCNIASQTIQYNGTLAVFLQNTGINVFAYNFSNTFNPLISGELYIGNCSMVGCQNYTPNDTATLNNFFQAQGMFLDYAQDCLIEDCFSGLHTQKGQPDGESISVTAGYQFSKTFGATIFRRCVATNNYDSGTGYAAGFTSLLNPPQDLQFLAIFEDCIAEENTTITHTGVGFDALSTIYGKIINCKAEGNNIGIRLSDTSGSLSQFNIVSNNIISGNTVYGIQDASADNSNAYYNNQAESNGATPADRTSDTNYNGGVLNSPNPPAPGANPLSAPIRYWLLPSQPDTINNNGVSGEKLDNISIGQAT